MNTEWEPVSRFILETTERISLESEIRTCTKTLSWIVCSSLSVRRNLGFFGGRGEGV